MVKEGTQKQEVFRKEQDADVVRFTKIADQQDHTVRLLKEMQTKVDKQVEDMKYFNKKARAEDYEDLTMGLAQAQDALKNIQHYHDKNRRQCDRMERDLAELQRQLPDTDNRLQAKFDQHTTQALLRMDYLDKTMQDINSRIERSAKSVQKHDAQLAELETKMYGSGEEIPIPARIEELFAAVKIVQEVQHKDLDGRMRMEN